MLPIGVRELLPEHDVSTAAYAEQARLTFSAAIEAFLTARAAEGASPNTVIWYRMVLGRAARAGWTAWRPNSL